MNTPIKKKTIRSLVIFCLCTWSMMAQQVPVYKIGDLLKRIHNASDTVYVVNFWATWCKPCVAELPEFEKLHTQYKDSLVKVLLVSLDFKEDMTGKLIPFLRKNNYTTDIVLLDEVNGNSFINQVSEKWSGAIPATLITTRNKSRQVFLEKKLTEAVIVEEIKKLQTP